MGRSIPLIPEQRHKTLLSLLRREGVMSTRQLTERLGVSHMTVRRDIAALEQTGDVVSVTGGVRLAEELGRQPPSARRQRAELELPRKHAIARAAADYIEDGMTIFLDAGTTCQSVIPEVLNRRGLTVVTNDFFVVLDLLDQPDITAIHVGGAVDCESGSSMGPLAAEQIKGINLDIFFLSTGTWSMQKGVTTPMLEKRELKRAAMASSTRTILIADSTKYGAASRFQVAPLQQLDLVITDDDLSKEVQQQLDVEEIEVRLAKIAR